MQHQISADRLGPHGAGMARAVSTCVHCGFCLAACPTYKVMGEEMDSPRGRIVLMKQVLEGDLSPEQARPFVDRCLGCLACETACPSGVRYRDLLVPYRARTEPVTQSTMDSWWREMLLTVMSSPARFRLALTLGQLSRRVAGVLPTRARQALALLPSSVPAPSPIPAFTPATSPRRARVALSVGCVQQVLAPEINRATIRVLAANGVDVIVPPEQGCCGALAHHVGDGRRAARLIAQHAAAFPADVDAIISNAAGCGSTMQEHTYSAPVLDVAAFLHKLALRGTPALEQPLTVAYHDACHLAHGQGVREAPRQLLRQVGGVTLVEVPDDLCCGSAGLYSLEHPDTARTLGARKAAAIAATHADMVATGNIGCITQLRQHAALPVRHTIEILAAAYARE